MIEDYPLISVIMPTRNRRQFLEQAIKLFQAQDYPNKELVIVDCSDDDSLERLVADDERIFYDWQPDPPSIGAMRNIACALARGEIICHMDDDDYFGSQRLSRQVAPILNDTADVTAMKMSLLLDVTTSTLYVCPEQAHAKLFPYDLRCGTLMYRASYWRDRLMYPNLQQGEDTLFFERLLLYGVQLQRITDLSSYICVRHGSNVTDGLDTTGWEQVPLEYYLSGDDLAFYMGLRSEVRV